MIESESKSYMASKLQQLDHVSTYRIYGHALEFEPAKATTGFIRTGHWTPIWPCICVQDSPENPCPCNPDHRWWLRDDTIIAHGKSGRRDHEGKELQFFDVLVDSKIMVESVELVSAGELRGMHNPVTPAQNPDRAATEAELRRVLGTIKFSIDEIFIGWAVAKFLDYLVEDGNDFLKKVKKYIEDSKRPK
jgi:hypothetical protein